MATIKHKVAFKEVVNGSSLSKAMVKAKYAESTSKRTNKLTRTKGWQELIDKYISEEKLAKVHSEGLKATKRQGVGGLAIGVSGGKVESVGHTEIEVPDYAVRHKYLETGYKVRGRLKDNPGGDTYNQFNFIDAKQLKRIAGRIQDGDPESETVSD